MKTFQIYLAFTYSDILAEYIDQLAEKDKMRRQMVQHQHIAYAQNYNCGARYLEFTLLLIAIYYLQIYNQEMDTKHIFLVQYMQHIVKRCELLLFYYYSICNIQLKDARITILFCGLWRTIPFPKNKHNSILI